MADDDLMSPNDIRRKAQACLVKAEEATNWGSGNGWTYIASGWIELYKAVSR